MNFISRVADEIHLGTSLKAGGSGKPPNGYRPCGGQIDDSADPGHLVTDRMTGEFPG